MEKSTIIGVLAILLFFFAATTLIFWLKIDSLSSNNIALKKAVDERDIVISNANGNITYANSVIASMRSNITERNRIIELLNGRLNQSYSDYDNLSTELSETEDELYSLRSEIDATISKVENLNRDINNSMKWFSDNSLLPLSLSREYSSLRSDCVDDGDGATVNLGCVPNTMKNAFDFNYRTDLVNDRLYTLDEMVANSGGDCEDFSLFVKAFLNSLKQDYSSSDSITLIGWDDDPGSGTWFFVTPRNQWGYRDAKEHVFGDLNNLTSYMVCYITEFDRANNTKVGHCVVAVSAIQGISGPDDLEGLRGAEMFEPQTGKYVGTIGMEFILCRNEEVECEDIPGSIMTIATDSDLYNFANSEWSSYSIWQNGTASLIQRLNGLKD